jgi:hypothetical protein
MLLSLQLDSLTAAASVAAWFQSAFISARWRLSPTAKFCKCAIMKLFWLAASKHVCPKTSKPMYDVVS